MGAGATLVGMAWGTTTIIYCNAMRRVAFFKRPWEHVLAAGIFAWGCNKVVQYEGWAEQRVYEETMRRIEANQGVLDDEYRRTLGMYYDKWFPEKS
mmetsp:Transcript_11253/g.18855  ORF Transcript_11253/g.18855 Transcript_11253/m.18855 type:complete len:96 (+) Transcript_11253:46-333(+)